jgi:hypothetical protein
MTSYLFTFYAEAGITSYYFETMKLYLFLETIAKMLKANSGEYGATGKADMPLLTRLYHICAILTNDEPVLKDALEFQTDWETKRHAYYKKLIGDFPFPQELLDELIMNPNHFMEEEYGCAVVRNGKEVDGLRIFAVMI